MVLRDTHLDDEAMQRVLAMLIKFLSKQKRMPFAYYKDSGCNDLGVSDIYFTD